MVEHINKHFTMRNVIKLPDLLWPNTAVKCPVLSTFEYRVWGRDEIPTGFHSPFLHTVIFGNHCGCGWAVWMLWIQRLALLTWVHLIALAHYSKAVTDEIGLNGKKLLVLKWHWSKWNGIGRWRSSTQSSTQLKLAPPLLFRTRGG